ncbi:MAG: hypothetical protein ACRDQ7_07245 [Haloechinothrix sp.]
MAEYEGSGNVSGGDSASGMLGAGGALSKEKLDAIKTDSSKLVGMARAGSFAVDPEGARGVAKAYRDMRDRIVMMRRNVDAAAQAPRLGSGPYALQVAEFTQRMARGDDKSFQAALDALEIICENSAEAHEIAANNYVEMDASAEQTFKNAGGNL